jgi:formate/nitrite transporter
MASDGAEFPLPDAYTPAQIAQRVEAAGVTKSTLPLVPLATLGVLAGAFIAFGAMFYTLVAGDPALGFAARRILGGTVFSLGLILVVVAGAELFTGNTLIVIGWADGKVTTGRLLRNWAIIWPANFVGAAATAVLVYTSGILDAGSGDMARAAAAIATAKASLGWFEAIVRGLLSNVLVCLAVWLTVAARDVAGKILAILFPITAFVALGFEHSVANMYFLPLGWLLGADGVTLTAIAHNLLFVTIGNVIGGGVLVALVYWLIYLAPWGRR